MSGADDRRLVLGAMRSGEWLRTQWIARVAFDLGCRGWAPAQARRVLAALKELHAAGHVEVRREGTIEGLPVAFEVPRDEWRITESGRRADRDGAEEISDETFEWFALTWLELHLLPEAGPCDRVRSGVSPVVSRAVSAVVSPAVSSTGDTDRRGAASDLPLPPRRSADINPSVRPIPRSSWPWTPVGPRLPDCVVQLAGRPATVGLAVALPWFASAAFAARLVGTRCALLRRIVGPGALPSATGGLRCTPLPDGFARTGSLAITTRTRRAADGGSDPAGAVVVALPRGPCRLKNFVNHG
ncbi:MAG: hypothetical protein JSU06_02900 [Actinobacteria bacterium]|nr:hypothetical protein [Actinomycetota bacterium]